MPSNVEQDMCNLMCVCCLIGSFVLLHSDHRQRLQVPQVAQQVEGHSSSVKVINGSLPYGGPCFTNKLFLIFLYRK